MPLLNSMGILRNMSLTVTTTPITGQQWIARFNQTTTNILSYGLTVSSTGESYFITPGSFGSTRLTTNGIKVFSKSTSGTGYTGINGSIICVDVNNNSYVGGRDTTAPIEYPLVIRYNSSGSVVWQITLTAETIGSFDDVLSMVTEPTGTYLFVLVGDETGGSPATGFGPYVLYKINITSGAIENQRLILSSGISAPSDLYIDTFNTKLLVTGTGYPVSSPSIILNGLYDYTNTDNPLLIYQGSTTDNYETFFEGENVNNGVTDGTYIYMTAYRVISGITKSVYMRVNATTGACDYSNQISITSSLTLQTITIDNLGFMYINGYNSAGSYIFKIRCSDGVIIWSKTLNFSTNDLIYNGGFLYMLATRSMPYPSTTKYQAIIKINSDGSLPDGTYATYWTFSSSSTITITSLLPQTTGTYPGTPLTTTYLTGTGSATIVNSGITISTTNIP